MSFDLTLRTQLATKRISGKNVSHGNKMVNKGLRNFVYSMCDRYMLFRNGIRAGGCYVSHIQ